MKVAALSLLLLTTAAHAQVRVLDQTRDSLLLKSYALIASHRDESAIGNLAASIQYLNSSLVYKQPCYSVITLPEFNKTYDFSNKGRTSARSYYLSRDRYRFLIETRIVAPEIKLEKWPKTKSNLKD